MKEVVVVASPVSGGINFLEHVPGRRQGTRWTGSGIPGVCRRPGFRISFRGEAIHGVINVVACLGILRNVGQIVEGIVRVCSQETGLRDVLAASTATRGAGDLANSAEPAEGIVLQLTALGVLARGSGADRDEHIVLGIRICDGSAATVGGYKGTVEGIVRNGLAGNGASPRTSSDARYAGFPRPSIRIVRLNHLIPCACAGRLKMANLN